MNNFFNLKFAGKIFGILIFLFSHSSLGFSSESFLDRLGRSYLEQQSSCGQVIKRFWGFEKKFASLHATILNNDRDITKKLISEYINLVDTIISRFTPDKYMYIGLGGSPTFIMAILENLGDNVVTLDFPLSIYNEKNEVEFTSNMENYIHNYLFQTLNDPRNYLLIDFVFMGKSLKKAHELLVDYCEKMGLKKKVEPFALRQTHELFPPKFQCEHEKMTGILTHHIRENYAKLYRKYPSVKFDEINTNFRVLNVSPEYQRLLEFFHYLLCDEKTPMSKL